MRPPIILPAVLGVSLEELFRAVDRGAVPELAPLLDYLAEHDPDVLAAIAEVDRSLIWSALESSPLELLHRCSENARGIQSLAAVLDPR